MSKYRGVRSNRLQAAKQVRDRSERGCRRTRRGSFQGIAQAFQDSLTTQPFLILAALVTVYIVLGILYESFVHPLTILSTLPSAGVGALLALLLWNTELSIIALIGLILLIGIVKKNAIMMIDFALEAERTEGKRPVEAIFHACLLRFRPIIMTTMAAALGALPLAIGPGIGSELRFPLGITAEYGGCIWIYMGPPETQPALPHLEWARVPDSQRVLSRWIQECNYMQALEGEIDSAHVSWLHAPLQVVDSPFRGRFNQRWKRRPHLGKWWSDKQSWRA